MARHAVFPCHACVVPAHIGQHDFSHTFAQDYAKETSYFASYITLTPEMNVRGGAAGLIACMRFVAESP